MADGYGFGGEGDWKIAALVRIVKLMATGLPGGTSFMEDYTYDLAGEVPLVLGSHMLEVCPSIAAARPRCEIHPLSIGAREDPVRLVFDAAPGPAFMFSMLDMGDRFRLLANEIDVIAPPQELPKLPVARAVWKPRPDFATAAEAWLIAGGPHHSVFSTALDTETLADFAADRGARAAADRRAHAHAATSPTRCAGTRPITGSPPGSERGQVGGGDGGGRPRLSVRGPP
jgi:L-arabinose isomerase